MSKGKISKHTRKYPIELGGKHVESHQDSGNYTFYYN